MDFFDANSLDIKDDELFDMDLHRSSDFLSEGWSASPDDLIDSFLSINGDFLKELDDSQNIQFNEIQTPLNVPASIDPPILSLPAVESDLNAFGDTNAGASFTQQKQFDVSEFINFTTKNEPMSSSSSDSGLSSDNMDVDVSPDYEPLSPAMSSPGPSISERGINSPARSVVSDHLPISFPAPVLATASNSPRLQVQILPKPQPIQQPVAVQPKPKTVIISSPTITTTNTKPRYVVEKIPAPMITNNNGQIRINQQPKKEVKIYKMTPASANVVNTVNGNGSKKVTIQMKDVQGKVSHHPPGTYVINKNNGSISGVRKLVRVQNQSQVSHAGRSILLPVSFQDVKDFRTIKIINASNLNNKSANIKLAAANMLQQSKQGLVQKNVLFSKEQLIDDSLSDPSTSDAESYVFEDVMMQTSKQSTPMAKQQLANQAMQSAKAHINQSSNSDADDDDEDDEDDDNSDYTHGAQMSAMNANGTYPKLMLTNEEKRLLDKEGISLPGNYPLTKHEERELKRIRRKIRNKISAQDSRKRKKEYVDGLEERVKQCTDENQTLIKRLKLLQSQHSNLSQQVKKLQAMLTKSGMTGNGNKTTQPATCLLVLLLSLALVAAPNLKLGQNSQETDLADALQEQQLQNRRTLLSDINEQLGEPLVDEENNIDDLMAFNDANEHDYATGMKSITDGVSAKKSRRVGEFVDFDVDDVVWKPPPIGIDLKFSEKASVFQESLKASAHMLDLERNAKFSAGGIGMFDVKMEPFDLLGISTDGNGLDSSQKLNESKTTTGERTILIKGA